MAMSVGGGGGVKSDINVTPMIDVMLVLLIIFMIVTPIISAGFQAQIPQAKNIEPSTTEKTDITLGIDQDGKYYLDPGTGKISPIAKDNLEAALTNLYQNRDDKILYFKADANLEYQKIEDAIEIVRKSGVRVIASVTEEPRGALLGGH
jgi:biopolymer transport protein ExbD/biopolymer transport protein TolR